MCASVCAYLLFLQPLYIHGHQVCIYKHFCDKLPILFNDSPAASGSTCSYAVEAVRTNVWVFLLKEITDYVLQSQRDWEGACEAVPHGR